MSGCGISADVSEPLDDSKGATMPWGKWQQDKEERVVLYVQLPEGCRGKEVQVKFGSKKLFIAVRGEERLKGDLFRPIIVDDSEWQLEDGQLVVSMVKQTKGWWDRVLMQDEPADTSHFDDVPYILGDMKDHEIDGARQMVERILTPQC